MADINAEIAELESALRESNDENIELRGENTILQGKLAQPLPTTLFTFFTLVHAQPNNDVMIFPMPGSIVGRAALATILRKAADGLVESIK